MGSSQSNVTSPLWDPVSQTCFSTYAAFENDWFEQGASRLAYMGRYIDKFGGYVDPAKHNTPCVVKLYKSDYQTRLGGSAFVADAKASMKAKELADRFNFDVPTNKPLKFLIPNIAKVQDNSGFNFLWLFRFSSDVKGKLSGTKEKSHVMIPVGATLAVEDFIHGQYVKFLSNSSWVNPYIDTRVPAAFSHYTYYVTGGQLLVCDIQGVLILNQYNQPNRYLLTDPAIHDAHNGPNYYGPTDHGASGVLHFFVGHLCNDLCRRYPRPDVNRAMGEHVVQQVINFQPRPMTTYTFQLEDAGISLGDLKRVQL